MKSDQFLKELSRRQNIAFRHLYSEYYADMVMYAANFADVLQSAEDIVQEVFLKFLEQEYHFETVAQLKTFLYTSVRNSCFNRAKHSFVKQKYEDYVKNEAPFQDSDDYKIIEQEVYALLFKAIDKLPERCKQIFELHISGKKNEEIAQIMKISVLTVKTQKKIGLKFLRKELGELFSIFF